jgi:hypothetical protein
MKTLAELQADYDEIEQKREEDNRIALERLDQLYLEMTKAEMQKRNESAGAGPA